MPWWPFRKRRRTGEAEKQSLHEKQSPASPDRAAPALIPPPAVPRRSSRRGKRSNSAQERTAETRSTTSRKRRGSPQTEKENKPSARRGSIEDDITALPISRRLQTSPHLRPADLERPHIPYNFRPYSSSQSSIQFTEAKSSRPPTLRSRASGTPSRMRSGRRAKGDDHVREEEIRAMSQPMVMSKRPGEGPLRRDSKKMRSLGARGSNVSLPHQGSIYSATSGVTEQRGWEVGIMDVFNPRPAVRLSGTPQHVASGSVPDPHTIREATSRDKEKRPMTRESAKKRETIGAQADDFDASDLRMLMEREKKRKERRDKDRQEKLDRKLRSRNGRNRGDSDRKRRDAEEKREQETTNERVEEEQRREDVVRSHANEEQNARDVVVPPTDLHPALRDQAPDETETVGLGIGTVKSPFEPETTHEHTQPATKELGTENIGTYLNYDKPEGLPSNPFVDPLPSPVPELDLSPTVPALSPPLETPLEEPVVQVAKEMRMSRSLTPPLSPIRGTTERIPSSLSRVATPDYPDPPVIPSERRTSEPKDRRAGAWASFFRRGGTNLRRPGEESRSATPSETSFSNISRESMRHQPLPAHLVDTAALPSQRRKSSNTPVRTQSKFREDLPEMPISPPESRMPSPDVTQAAALAAAARRQKRASKPKPVNIPESRAETPDPSTINRNDTPVSPTRAHGMMSSSLASMDSEGSWLASSSQRQSTQSAISRSMGSLSKRKPEFSASYEELGGDKDAEYFQNASSVAQRMDETALAGANAEEESMYGEAAEVSTSDDPLAVHESVRRKPTLVHRDPRFKSREALAEYAAPAEPDSPSSKYEFDVGETPDSELRSAKSVDYGKGHARQVSAGSAILLDIPASKRHSIHSVDALNASPAGSVPSTSRTSQL
ncbi:hypothetical protein LTR15_000675 [Elasticomyces elasticus]|nr:hypothetical protein LTR15_000675 [Elasticomyces elasticus]